MLLLPWTRRICQLAERTPQSHGRFFCGNDGSLIGLDGVFTCGILLKIGIDTGARCEATVCATTSISLYSDKADASLGAGERSNNLRLQRLGEPTPLATYRFHCIRASLGQRGYGTFNRARRFVT
jgi:hypothetical protein